MWRSPKMEHRLRLSRRAFPRNPSTPSDRQTAPDDRRLALAQPPFPHPKRTHHPILNASTHFASCSSPLLSLCGDSSPQKSIIPASAPLAQSRRCLLRRQLESSHWLRLHSPANRTQQAKLFPFPPGQRRHLPLPAKNSQATV